MKQYAIPLILIALALVVAGCSTVEEQNKDPFGFDFYMNQVDLCYILGVQYDEFESFMEEKGIRTMAQGDETYIVTVHESKKQKALRIIEEYDLQKRFFIDLNLLHQSSAIQSE
jgi:hypothetical protein